jgi:hypothetical protein
LLPFAMLELGGVLVSTRPADHATGHDHPG